MWPSAQAYLSRSALRWASKSLWPWESLMDVVTEKATALT
jgi:hypothetical protein